MANLRVYPNPMRDFVNVQCAFEVKTIEVYDVYGKLFNTMNVMGDQTRVNVSELPAGVYVLCVTDADGHEYHQKIIKQ